MSEASALECRVDERRRKLFGNKAWNGIDYLDVADDQMSLCVHFFGGIPQGIGPANIRIGGGRRITGIVPVRVEYDPSHDEELDDCLRIVLDRPGDFSTYTLCLVDVPGIDPRFACHDFNFKTNCPSDIDCGERAPCPPEPRTEPDINYLAKDYASFRQLIYDRMALILPDWRERHAADLGVMLVEILAYAGDHLSYYQDAVATEAYLDTARLRISVRRHLRLIGYHMHEGCNARAFVTIASTADFTLDPDNAYFITDVPGLDPPAGKVVREPELQPVPAQRYEVFEPVATPPAGFDIHAAHSAIRFHGWGDGECCLPAGSTHASLVDHGGESDPKADQRLKLAPGDLLIFEEIRGPVTGSPADADPSHRHVVRLTDVAWVHDALLETLVAEIEWGAEDALPFALCISSRRPSPDCDTLGDVSIARGNVVLVDHGCRGTRSFDPVPGRDIIGECACEGSILEARREALPFEPVLDRAPVTFAAPVRADAPAAALIEQDPRAALPAIALDEAAAGWQPRQELLSSGADDRGFVAEIDDEGFAHLRFGDGVHGRRPDADSVLTARYRIGSGTVGNVGRDTITRLVLRQGTIDADSITARNPLPARGGTAPEPVAEARLLAPGMIQARRERAIVAEDYAELALREPRLQGAAASLRWCGSWREARVAIDPAQCEDAAPGLLGDVAGALHRYCRIGHDLAVVEGRFVPLRLALQVCVLAHYSRAHVKAALLDALGSRPRIGGGLGFFHPDNWRFGQPVALSQIVAAAMRIDGIETVRVTALSRLNTPGDTGALDSGQLVIGHGEIARLDNDPDFPENGKLELAIGGGQ